MINPATETGWEVDYSRSDHPSIRETVHAQSPFYRQFSHQFILLWRVYELWGQKNVFVLIFSFRNDEKFKNIFIVLVSDRQLVVLGSDLSRNQFHLVRKMLNYSKTPDLIWKSVVAKLRRKIQPQRSQRELKIHGWLDQNMKVDSESSKIKLD